MIKKYQSWGRYPAVFQEGIILPDRVYPFKNIYFEKDKKFLPFGNGRSYGDSCLNQNGFVLDTKNLSHFISFDEINGILRCEAGVLLSDILELIVPNGWFLPVTPGTKFVTVGGAIANDIHGKNHHREGSFGCHVLAFELLRSDGQRFYCSHDQNRDWFSSTIGGLGLTGLITWAEIKLKKIVCSFIDSQVVKMQNLDDFFSLSEESENDEYTVSWVDCFKRGKNLGRGFFIRGNHSKESISKKYSPKKISVYCEFPFSPINRLTSSMMNRLLFLKQKKNKIETTHYDPFFYPLDGILNWNRAYGKNGFLQHQCVIPEQNGKDAVREILDRVAASKLGSFLSVLKMFGVKKSPGLLSFPRAGVTLALDFPFSGKKTLDLLDELDVIVDVAGGTGYPAKDARMKPDIFLKNYPVSIFEKYIDPHFSSGFWERMKKI